MVESQVLDSQHICKVILCRYDEAERQRITLNDFSSFHPMIKVSQRLSFEKIACIDRDD